MTKNQIIKLIEKEAKVAYENSKKYEGTLKAQFCAVQYKLVELLNEIK